ncbi:unnamed protein product [Peronospora destructor]|uniref:RING-type E3 ubiquitin transferase BRCA1 n=1 Tax=Peronospora destructor TaxID=86335 RepID=A0AAV0V4Q1_9STRA|nr:unnamed protein product [Peronospora destructor]
MTLLSSSRLEAIRLIREQLQCSLCGNIFQDPQCLDCKHNFCRPCILLHLKKNNSHCPNCQLPTRPSEVTRNQFLESILLAWKGVETELETLNGDSGLHAGKFTVQDTDQALHRAVNGSGAVTINKDSQQEERHFTRGRVANNKWHINTQEIRQELKLEQPYLPQYYGARRPGNTDCWKKTSSSDLSDDYGGSAIKEDENNRRNGGRTNKPSVDEVDQVEQEEMTRWVQSGGEEEKEENYGSVSSSIHSLMATQEVESYMDRITKQREALSQWERSGHGKNDGKASLLDLERSLHSSYDFDELLKERRRELQHHDDDGDLLTQMTQMTQTPPYTSALESPDLLASFRRQHYTVEYRRRHVNDSACPLVRTITRLTATSPHRLPIPHKLFQIPITKTKPPDIQPATMLQDEADKETDDEEEYETKPAMPIPHTPEHKASLSDRHCERLRDLFSRKKEHVSDDYGSAITAFQSEHKYGSGSPKIQAARELMYSVSQNKTVAGAIAVARDGDGARLTSAESLSKPPKHTSTSNSKRSESKSNYVFVSSDLTREQVKCVLEATQRLEGKFGHDFDLQRDPLTGHFCTSVTHLITKAVPPIGAISDTEPDELRCKRTAKYMRGLSEGIFVMDFSWITASLAVGRWLTEEPFEMIGDIYSDAVGKPHEGRIRRMQTGRRNSIFSMFSFVLLVSEQEFDFQFNSVKTLVNNFGGTVVHAETFAKPTKKNRSRRTCVGVVSKITLPSDAKAKWQQFQIPIVRITWIFDSMSHLEVLPFDDYYPY